MTVPRAFAFTIALVLAFAVQSRVLANPSIHDRLASLPSEPSLVLAIDNAADLRRGELGRDMGELVRNLVGVGEVETVARAWKSLAMRLRLAPEQAFDDLLGTRVVYLRDGQAWTLLATIDRATEQRIRTSLKPAPRQPVKGRQILSLEEGTFVMSLLPDEGEGGAITLVIAPDENRALFLRVIDPAAARKPFGATRAAAMLRTLGDAPSALLAWRDESRTICLSGVPDGRGFSITLGARVDGLERPEMPPVWSSDVLDRASVGAHAAVIEFESPVYTALFESDAFLEPVARLKEMFKGDALVGSRRAMRLASTDFAPVSLAIGIETTDPGPMSDEADAFMSRFVSSSNIAGEDLDPDDLDMRGIAPGALRTIPRRAEDGRVTDAMFGGGPDFSWLVSQPALPGASGWWVTGTDAKSVLVLKDRLEQPDDANAPRKAWVMLAALKPEKLAQAFASVEIVIRAADPEIASVFDFARRIESFDLRAYHTDPSTIRGNASVRFKSESPALR